MKFLKKNLFRKIAIYAISFIISLYVFPVWWCSMDSAWKRQVAPLFSLLVLSSLTPKKHRVTIEDENVETLNFDDSPDLVGITVKVDSYNR